MTCQTVPLPGGGLAIVCHRGARWNVRRCRWCTHTAGVFECDWRLPSGRTCSKSLCAGHAFQVDADKHLCPTHVDAYRRWLVSQGIALT